MIQWEKKEGTRLPVKSWCRDIEEGALKQAINLANHPVLVSHVALMPDAHVGYGMPIGGVIACDSAVIPNAVGVDIGCGMGAIKTNINYSELSDMHFLRNIMDDLKRLIPVGEGHSRHNPVHWDGFEEWLDSLEKRNKPGWFTDNGYQLDQCNLGTLGGGNHFIELQKSQENIVWLMLHSGSRNLGYRVANYYHKEALNLDKMLNLLIPDSELAYLPVDHELGQAYIRDMNFALRYAAENRRIMMEMLKEVVAEHIKSAKYLFEVNIHHNYAAKEQYDGKDVWIHRKGATSARKGETGIIPGSMGTSSYIVEGLGNIESFVSCSHGAGRRMGRAAACRQLDKNACDVAMKGIVFDSWKTSDIKGPDKKKLPDLSEAPLAYKNIDDVIEAELDLVRPIEKLQPLAVIKG